MLPYCFIKITYFQTFRFLITNIRNNNDYSPRSFYWLGAELSKNSEIEWTDGSVMNFRGWLPGQDNVEKTSEPVCLGLQWKISPTPMLSSGLYWSYQKCSGVGGYVCKQSKKNIVLIQNQTIIGTEGRIMSPGKFSNRNIYRYKYAIILTEYPSQYASNINYWIKITSPEKSRIIVQFQKFDIEEQNECLYDYVSVQDEEFFFESASRQEHLLDKINKFTLYDTFEDYQSDRSANDDNTLQIDESSEIKDESFKYYNKYDRKRSIHTIRKRESSISFSTKENYGKISSKFLPYVRWCGKYDADMSQFDFISKSNVVLLNFYTDFTTAGEGFSATWRSIDVSACPVQTLTSAEGQISSPNYPHFLIHELECTYIIQGASGKKIVIEFVGFDMGNDASVLIDLGNSDGKFQPYRSQNIASDGFYISESGKVEVYLKTGSKPNGKGFKLKYKTSKYFHNKHY